MNLTITLDFGKNFFLWAVRVKYLSLDVYYRASKISNIYGKYPTENYLELIALNILDE